MISGQQLPKPKASGAKGDTIDPYVSVEIFGIPADCAEERTKTIQHIGKYSFISMKLYLFIIKSSVVLVSNSLDHFIQYLQLLVKHR